MPSPLLRKFCTIHSIGIVIPELNGKLDGKAIRVPTPNVSVIDLVINASKSTDAVAVNEAIRAAANGPLKNVLQIIDDKTVSIDFHRRDGCDGRQSHSCAKLV